jgi:hypothetical protein
MEQNEEIPKVLRRRLKQIAVGVGLTDSRCYGLDTDGRVWCIEAGDLKWRYLPELPQSEIDDE